MFAGMNLFDKCRIYTIIVDKGEFDMKITKTINGSIATIIPEGMIDTVNSPAFENEAETVLSQTNNIIMDFSHVEYISSSGLRVLLKIQKKIASTNGEMKITNVNNSIKEVFEVTGFSDILTIC